MISLSENSNLILTSIITVFCITNNENIDKSKKITPKYKYFYTNFKWLEKLSSVELASPKSNYFVTMDLEKSVSI